MKNILRILSLLRQKQEQIKERLRGAWLHRVFGEHLFREHLWVHDQRALAGGLALGLFVAFTPTIPLQMLLAAVGAYYFRFNLPIALAACWVTNPVTMGPIYLACWKLGRLVLEEVIIIERLFDFFSQTGRINSIVRQSAYLWTGSLIIATAVALLGYGLVWLTWNILAGMLARVRSHRE